MVRQLELTSLFSFSMLPQTSESFWSEMVRLNSDQRLKKDSAYAFDVAWVIALTLNASMADGLTYERLNKRTWKEVRLIKKWIGKTNFQGITVSNRKKNKQSCTFSWVAGYVNVNSQYLEQKFSPTHTDVFTILLPYSWFPGYGICPGLTANEIQPYDKRHKVSSLVKSHQNTPNSFKYEVLIEQYLRSILDKWNI